MRKLLTGWLLFTLMWLVHAATLETSFAIPELLWNQPFQAQLIDSLVLVSSPHARWIYAFTPEGQALWKRQLEWPIGELMRIDQGLLLVHGPDARAEAIRLDTGERLLRQPRLRPAWVTPRLQDASQPDWLALTPEGRLQSWDPHWNPSGELGRLSLPRQDAWWGPPVELPWGVFAGSFRGQLQQWTPQKVYIHTQLDHPLMPLLAHPQGVVQISQDGRLLFQGKNRFWLADFPGQTQCYNSRGELIARPCWDQQGNLYLAHAKGLISWSADGALRWHSSLNCSSAPATSQGQVVVVEAESSLAFLDAGTGQRLGQQPLPAPAGPQLSLDSRRMAVPLRDHRVLVLDHWRR